MSDHGITLTGFKRKTLAEILAGKDSAVKGVFGPEINLSPQSPDGQINGLSALSEDLLWQIAEDVYNATDPDKATGLALSNLVKLNRLGRQEESKSRYTVQLGGTPNEVIAAGQLISDGGNIQATIALGFTFDAAGTTTAIAEINVVGEVELINGALNTIDTPQNGWDTVSNINLVELGRLREEDGPLRIRRSRSTGISSRNQLETLLAALGNLQGVTSVKVLENDTDVIDPITNVPPHSFEAIVEGSSDSAITDTIWLNKPTGIAATGSVSAVVSDSQGLPHAVSFTRPVEVPIFVVVTIKKKVGYPADGDDTIKANIVKYAGGELVADRGFGPNSNVVYSELYTPINTVPNHDITDLRIGTATNPTGTSNIVIALRSASKFTEANITIVEAP